MEKQTGLMMDDRRRITLPKGLADPKERFVAFRVRDEIILKALPKDPIKALEELGRKIPKDVTFEDMKKAAKEEMIKAVERREKRREEMRKSGK